MSPAWPSQPWLLFVSSLPQCWAASPPQWLSNTMASSARPGNFHLEIMSQQQMSRIPPSCKQSVLCLSWNCKCFRGTWQYYRGEWRAMTSSEGRFVILTCKSSSRNSHGQRIFLEGSLTYSSFRSVQINSTGGVCYMWFDWEEEEFKMCSEVRMMSAAAVSTLSSISSSLSSSGSICDLWGVSYPSDFIPGGGGHWLQHHHHRHQHLSSARVDNRN